MQIIPLSAVPSQALSVLLSGQNCQINVYEKSNGVYLDLFINNVAVVSGQLCLDRDPMVTKVYLGFVGTLQFSDILGTTDPVSSGFGERYFLVYNP